MMKPEYTDPNQFTMKPAQQKRGTRSYVLRQGRISIAQKKALDNHYDDYVLNDQSIQKLTTAFAKQQPVTCSIGFGMGEALLLQAQKNPDKNFFGVEVHAPGVGALIEGIVKLALTNILIAHRDVTTVIDLLPKQSIQVWQIFFPDPWHKKRHHKRRLIQDNFLNALATKTHPEGHLHIATDWAHYAEHCQEVLVENDSWTNTCQPGADNYPYLPKGDCYQLREETKYERRGKRLGHEIFDLWYQLKS